ncbi:MAG: TlpA disulfide reductase family protein [Thermomicrobiales bacterium]
MVGAENVMGLLDPTRRAVPLNGNGSQPPLGPLVRIGSPAPAFQLPDLDGQPVTTGVLENNETLVLFWDPACGFCQRMLDDLKRWESERSGDAPELLVVSTGTVEVNRAMGLRSTVVLDQGFGLGRQFGASGTPSAVLVDRKGRVSSQVVAGAEAVLDLAGATAIPSGS